VIPFQHKHSFCGDEATSDLCHAAAEGEVRCCDRAALSVTEQMARRVVGERLDGYGQNAA
jgi:hypothetical protein